MKLFILFVLTFIYAATISGQIKKLPSKNRDSVFLKTKGSVKSDSLMFGKKGEKSNKKGQRDSEKKADITKYKIISFQNDTTYVDTTLSIQKEFKFNYLRKDNFELLPFSNIGQTYNTLSKDFFLDRLIPKFGVRSKHYNYLEKEDIQYYWVPTPLTELMYKTAFEQGQLLDAFFTVNTSEQFNFSIAYKGLRSLGKYQHLLTSTGNFRFTAQFNSKNNRYFARGHIVMQDVMNEENGGLQDSEIVFFETGEEEHKDRAVFDMAFQNAQGELRGKRFYIDHHYLLTPNDSTVTNSIKIYNVLALEDKYYTFKQDQAQTEVFGSSLVSEVIFNKVKSETFSSTMGVDYKNKTIGQIKLGISYTDFNYGYNTVMKLNNTRFPNRILGQSINLEGNYFKQFKRMSFGAEFQSFLIHDLRGYSIKGKIGYRFKDADGDYLQLDIKSNSKPVNFNFQLFQSDYLSYNWKNDFENTKTQQFALKLKLWKLPELAVDWSKIDRHLYFKNTEIDSSALRAIKPFQNTRTINYLRVKAVKDFHFGKFTLHNTLMYQNIEDEEHSVNMPTFITRNTLYLSTDFFKRALFLQTGVTLNYFSEYYMDAYDPVLSEFYSQTKQKYGGFPRLDFFVNAKVKHTRIFLKAEHFNSAWTGYNFYSAPQYPYRDFSVRFGLVWNFFR